MEELQWTATAGLTGHYRCDRAGVRGHACSADGPSSSVTVSAAFAASPESS